MADLEMVSGRLRRRLEDPFTKRRLVAFLCLHFVALGAELAALLIFLYTKAPSWIMLNEC